MLLSAVTFQIMTVHRLHPSLLSVRVIFASSGQLSGVTVAYQVVEENPPMDLVQNRAQSILVRCPSAALYIGGKIERDLAKIQIPRLPLNAKILMEGLKKFLKVTTLVSLFSVQVRKHCSSCSKGILGTQILVLFCQLLSHDKFHVVSNLIIC